MFSNKAKERYESKVAKVRLKIDPYELVWCDSNPDIIPRITWSDMIIYITKTPSPYTGEGIIEVCSNELKMAVIYVAK